MCSSDWVYAKKDFLDVWSLAMKRGNNHAFHIIQSFSPTDDVNPQQALEIGKEFMKRAIPNYQYVISTHSDRKHIHNHIIFNSVDLIKHRKYHSNKDTLENLRKISDMICEEHSLSVITPTKLPQRIILRGDIDNAVKQSNCYEDFLKIMQSYVYEVKIGKYLYFRKQGNKNFINTQTLGTAYIEKNIISKIYGTDDIQNHNIAPHLNHFIKRSYRKLLKNSIDYALKESSDFEDFLKKMSEQDYEIKCGKHLAFRHNTGKRFIRVESLGDLYTEYMLRLYFENNEEYEKIKNEIQPVINKYAEQEKEFHSRYINSLNVNIGIKMLNYLKENKIGNYAELFEKIDNASDREKKSLREKEKTENSIKSITEGLNALKIYHRYKAVYDKYNSLSDENFEKTFFGLNSRNELEKFNNALAIVNSLRKYDNSIPTVDELEKTIEKKKEQINFCEKNILRSRADLKNLETIKSNLLSIGNLFIEELQEQEERTQETQKYRKNNDVSL